MDYAAVVVKAVADALEERGRSAKGITHASREKAALVHAVHDQPGVAGRAEKKKGRVYQ